MCFRGIGQQDVGTCQLRPVGLADKPQAVNVLFMPDRQLKGDLLPRGDVKELYVVFGAVCQLMVLVGVQAVRVVAEEERNMILFDIFRAIRVMRANGGGMT